jgi:hypothetical protein
MSTVEKFAGQRAHKALFVFKPVRKAEVDPVPVG